jgi:hypothetical protein
LTDRPSVGRERLRFITPILVVVVCAMALPFALGYVYAWTWVIPYTSVCKESLFQSDFTAEEYHNYLLNHGCDVDKEIRRFVSEYYASLDKPLNDFPSQSIPGPGPTQTPPQQVEATAERMVLIYDGKAQLQSATEVTLSDEVRFYMNGFRSFEFPNQDCALGAFCTSKTFWGDDIISRFFAWIGDKYLSFAMPLLLTAIGYGATQVADFWAQGPLLRGGLILAYAIATGLLGAAIYEFLKWCLKDSPK